MSDLWAKDCDKVWFCGHRVNMVCPNCGYRGMCEYGSETKKCCEANCPRYDSKKKKWISEGKMR